MPHLTAKRYGYLSYFYPDGLANMQKNTPRVKKIMPVMVVMSSEDFSFRQGMGFLFDHFKPQPKSIYKETSAGHLGTPEAVADDVLAFIKSLAR